MQHFLLGHNCEVTALPEGAESWFGGLGFILPEEERERDMEKCICDLRMKVNSLIIITII